MTRRPQRRLPAGFTMIELLVVIVIIGLLAAVAIPNFAGAQDKSRNANVQANLHIVEQAIEIWGADISHNYPARTDTAVEGHALLGTGDNYLSADKYPPTPWETQQAANVSLPFDNVPNNHVYSVQGIRNNPDSTASYGAICYSNTTTQGQYQLGATGKKGNNPMRVLTLKNF
ncbi:MAG: type II secretion system protein [Candidatus Sericytochromatia bacterium]|nr:type II secretion system protein [Candidatus Sericytochromatia bacterium]